MQTNNQQLIREQIIHGVGKSFLYKEYDHFTMPWHYHEELELILITKGGGQRFVGDYTEEFKPGDLLLFGSELPHFHMCDGLVRNEPELVSSCEVIQFSKKLFPKNIENVEEFRLIADLLVRSERGIKFTSPPNIEIVSSIMKNIDSLKGVKRITKLFRVLEILARIPEYKLLTSANYSSNLVGANHNDPVNKVYKFLYENFKNDITLDEISSYLGYNKSALCRHYKQRAQKGIMETLQEIRIGFACRMLVNSSLNISQVAFECGYNNISNFNRQFLVITRLTPTAYKKLYMSGIRE